MKQKDDDDDEVVLPSISMKREIIRFIAIFFTIISTLGSGIWLWADNHWLHPTEFEKHVAQYTKDKEDFGRYKIEQMRSLYFLRLTIMDEQLTALRERKHTYPDKWDGLSEARIIKMERDYGNIYQMYMADPSTKSK